jgi:hypothetical protein
MVCSPLSLTSNNHVIIDTHRLVTFSIVQTIVVVRTCIGNTFLSPLATFSPHLDQFTLSLFLCLSLHSHPAAESGNAVRDLSSDAVIMRTLLAILRVPAYGTVRRGSLVLIAP